MEGILYLSILGGAYGLLYYLNHKTPVPAGCEDLKADCEGCKIHSCGNHPTKREYKEELK